MIDYNKGQGKIWGKYLWLKEKYNKTIDHFQSGSRRKEVQCAEPELARSFLKLKKIERGSSVEGGMYNMVFRINNAGDACCIQIGVDFPYDLLLDFGFSRDDKFMDFMQKQAIEKTRFGRMFVLSHYHTDHFNGFERLKKTSTKLMLDDLYIPRIPDLDPAYKEKISKELVFYIS